MAPITVTPKPVPPKKSADGLFVGELITDAGVKALSLYASSWIRGERNLDVERAFPGLAEEFYAVRADSDYALRFADPIPQPAPPPAVYVPGKLPA